MSHTPVNNGNSKESFNKQTTLLEQRIDESIPWDQKYKSSKELFKIKKTKMPIAVPVSTRENKRTVKQYVAKPLRKTVDSESNQKPRNTLRKLYERISKACSWWYLKFTPSGYNWKPKFKIENVKPNVSMPLGNASRTANVLDPMTSRCSTVLNTPLSYNSFAARRDYPIHRRL
nr:hypothetical protein [Tanacetum cinerariifolium]